MLRYVDFPTVKGELMSIISASARGVRRLTGNLLTQVEPEDASSLRDITDDANGGMVVSGVQALTLVEHLGATGYSAPLLPDRQRYKGKNRLPASHPFDPNWIQRQRRLRLPAIVPDAGYVAEADLVGLRSVLARSAQIDGAVALLALANWWLYGPGLRLLLGELRDTKTPVALVMEHKEDPLGVRRIFDGVMALLRSGPPVLPLRCDPSVLGLLAHGALAAAFGSKTSLRHLYPQPKKGGGGGGNGTESVFWPGGMALHYKDLLYDAVTATPDDPRWRCVCRPCDGRRLDRFQFAMIEEIRMHNSACLLDLRAALFDLPAGQARQRFWSTLCRSAELAHESTSVGPVELRCPAAMHHWQHL